MSNADTDGEPTTRWAFLEVIPLTDGPAQRPFRNHQGIDSTVNDAALIVEVREVWDAPAQEWAMASGPDAYRVIQPNGDAPPLPGGKR